MLEKSEELKRIFNQRRTYRNFIEADIDIEIIKNCILAASSAPSGANQQGYSFVVVKSDEMKDKIRAISEENEATFYNNEKNKSWHDDLKKLKTNFQKPFLTEASYLICIFYHNKLANGNKIYYPLHGVGLASGMLLSALNQVGLNTITYTPSGMNFMKELLDRESYEIPYLIVACGIKDDSYELPNIKRKTLSELIDIY